MNEDGLDDQRYSKGRDTRRANRPHRVKKDSKKLASWQKRLTLGIEKTSGAKAAQKRAGQQNGIRYRGCGARSKWFST